MPQFNDYEPIVGAQVHLHGDLARAGRPGGDDGVVADLVQGLAQAPDRADGGALPIGLTGLDEEGPGRGHIRHQRLQAPRGIDATRQLEPGDAGSALGVRRPGAE